MCLFVSNLNTCNQNVEIISIKISFTALLCLEGIHVDASMNKMTTRKEISICRLISLKQF